MKKKLITILLTLSVITLIGCADAAETKAGDEKFIRIYTQDTMTTFNIYVDTETGVEYITVIGNGPTITPRLNSEGKPMIETKYIKK